MHRDSQDTPFQVNSGEALHDTEKLLCLSSSVHALPLDLTTPRDSYAWNYRELTTLLTLSEISAESGFELLTIGSMH